MTSAGLQSRYLRSMRRSRWQERYNLSDTSHPEFERFVQVTSKLKAGRRERAQQFFNWCLVENVRPADPVEIEREINACVKLLVDRGLV